MNDATRKKWLAIDGIFTLKLRNEIFHVTRLSGKKIRGKKIVKVINKRKKKKRMNLKLERKRMSGKLSRSGQKKIDALIQ